MDRLACFEIFLILNLLLCQSVQSINFVENKTNESSTTFENETSISRPTKSNFPQNVQQISTTSPTILANSTKMFVSTKIFKALITKPNSYLYDPTEFEYDNDERSKRIKRDPAPFVCKSKALDVS